MATTTSSKQQATRPMSYYWNVVKDMDNTQKLELVTMLVESLKPMQTKSLTDVMMEQDFHDMGKELYTPEEAYDMTMKDIREIYDAEDAV